MPKMKKMCSRVFDRGSSFESIKAYVPNFAHFEIQTDYFSLFGMFIFSLTTFQQLIALCTQTHMSFTAVLENGFGQALQLVFSLPNANGNFYS